MASGKLWTQSDRFGNDIYLTEERWRHISDPDNHPEVGPHFDLIRDTIRKGRRRQDPLDPQGWQYYHPFDDLPDDNSHVVVCVRLKMVDDDEGGAHEERFVITAYFQLF
ncbi:MAG: hypothetical protein HY023_05120 [Chloroflexi bacterium]|nr:hypothetical protein [Chloroflexota bacterium]MBI3762706.1 hypothetical protein [Chloroflexota bacterium]